MRAAAAQSEKNFPLGCGEWGSHALLMADILHHVRYKKPYKNHGIKVPINWCWLLSRVVQDFMKMLG